MIVFVGINFVTIGHAGVAVFSDYRMFIVERQPISFSFDCDTLILFVKVEDTDLVVFDSIN